MIGGGNWTPPNIGARAQTLGVNTSGATTGTTITSGADAKGSWVDIGGTTSFAFKRMVANLVNNNTANDMIVDIGINVGGNRFVIAENLTFHTARRAIQDPTAYYDLPLYVPAGAQLSARCHAAANTETAQVSITGFSNGVGGMAPFSRCRQLYTPSANENGVAIDPGGTVNTKGAWTEITASSGFHAAAIMFSFGFNDDIIRAADARAVLDIGIGAASSEQILLADFLLGWGVLMDGPFIPSLPILPFYIPSGTRIIARAQCSHNTAGDRTFGLAMWGFEP